MDLNSACFAKRKKLNMPWETPGFLNDVLGVSTSPLFRSSDPSKLEWSLDFVVDRTMPVQQEPVPAVASDSLPRVVPPIAGVGCSFFSVARKRVPLPWKQGVELSWQAPLDKWKDVAKLNLEASVLGRQILEVIDSDDSEVRVDRIMNDTFLVKSVGTLNKRSGSMLEFSRWSLATFPKFKVFPLLESRCYDYFKEMRQAKAAKTQPSSFMEAVGFCQGQIGLEGAEEVRASARCRGVMLSLERGHFILKVDGFTVADIWILESAVSGELVNGVLLSGPDLVFGGYMLSLTHGRSRWSDLQILEKEPYIDGDDNEEYDSFLECGSQHTKTSNSSRARRKSITTIECLARGISGKPWARSWLAERRRLGLVAGPNSPTMPAVDSNGKFTAARLTAGEANIWLRELFLSLGIVRGEGTATSTRSAKTSLLAICAKYGLPSADRALLGYHSRPGEQMVQEYSRDNQARCLRLLATVFEAIRSGAFCPDETRSGRFRKEPHVCLNDAMQLLTNTAKPSDVDLTEDARLNGQFNYASEADEKNVDQFPCEALSHEFTAGIVTSDEELRLTSSESDDGFSPAVVAPRPAKGSDFTCYRCANSFDCLTCCFECRQCGSLVCLECSADLGEPWSEPCLQCEALLSRIEPSSDVDCSDSSGSDDSSSDDEGNDVAACRVAASLFGAVEQDDVAHGYAQHAESSVMHIVRNVDVDPLDGDVTILDFECGRTFSKQYRPKAKMPEFPYPRCAQCFRLKAN